MKNILTQLKDIEKKNNIKILFAVETGSRVWRMESSNSDYDIRFVYIRDAMSYQRIGKLPDSIDSTEGEHDFLGFDIYKFTKLLLNSNPATIEWLNSDIVYINDGETIVLFKIFIENNFNPKALYHHYRSMCKQNYLKYLKTSALMTHKKYLYCMRGLVNAKWVQLYNMIPPIDFKKTACKLRCKLPKDVQEKILEIIDLKKTGFEEVKVSKIHLFEKYIEEFLEKEDKIEPRKITDYQEIQQYIWSLLRA